MTKTREESAELRDYRERVRQWLKKNIPAQPDFHVPHGVLEVETKQQLDWLRIWQKKCYEAGLVGVDVPKKYGGAGLTTAHASIVRQELARAQAPILFNFVALQMALPTILVHGTEEQKQRHVAKILSGDEIWCQGFSEPNAGSDLASVQTFVEKRGDHWVANGHKIWTTIGQFAHYMILLARTDKSVPKHQGLSYFLMPMDAEGVEVRPLVKMTKEATFNQVIIEEVKFPLENILGKEGEGWRVAMTTLTYERGAAGVGEFSAHTSFELLLGNIIALARKTKREGRAMIEDPHVRDRLAAFAVELEAMKGHANRLANPKLQDWPMGLPLMMKLYSSELGMEMEELAQYIQGPLAQYEPGSPGAIDGGDWQLDHMNAYGPVIGGGTSEIQKNILGERVLGLAKG